MASRFEQLIVVGRIERSTRRMARHEAEPQMLIGCRMTYLDPSCGRWCGNGSFVISVALSRMLGLPLIRAVPIRFDDEWLP